MPKFRELSVTVLPVSVPFQPELTIGLMYPTRPLPHDLVAHSSASPLERKQSTSCVEQLNSMDAVSILFKCSCRDPEPAQSESPNTTSLLRHVLRLIDPFEFTVVHQELGQFASSASSRG